MLIHGMITIQDLNNTTKRARPRRSCLLTKKRLEAYYLSVKNSKYPDCIDYKISNIDTINSQTSSVREIQFIFTVPRHSVTVKCDDVRMKKVLLRQIQNIRNGKFVMIIDREMPEIVPRRNETFTPKNFVSSATNFKAIDRFDPRILNMEFLKDLTLENCVLPMLPVQIGNLPIDYLSLAGSILASTRLEQDTFWDWMSQNRICNTLTILNLNSIGLLSIPFEVMFLKKLNNLSVAKNKLTYLPPFLGELKKLEYLDVSDNALNYFPNSLYNIIFVELNIRNNPFTESESLSNDHIYKCTVQLHNNEREKNSVVKPFANIIFASLMEFRVKFKRQDMPRPLWNYFNIIGRCAHCSKFITPQYSIVRHINRGFPIVATLKKCSSTRSLPRQLLLCRYRCK